MAIKLLAKYAKENVEEDKAEIIQEVPREKEQTQNIEVENVDHDNFELGRIDEEHRQ